MKIRYSVVAALAAVMAISAGTANAQAPDVGTIVAGELARQEQCEQRAQIGKVLKQLIAEANGASCPAYLAPAPAPVAGAVAGGAAAPAPPANPFLSVIDAELARQRMCEERRKVGQALKALTDAATEGCDKKEEEKKKPCVVEPACYYYVPVCRD